MKIYKARIVPGRNTLSLPARAKIQHFGYQAGYGFAVWYIETQTNINHDRKFYAVMTGEDIPSGYEYKMTAMTDNGTRALHLCEEKIHCTPV